jgi:hypothetical protein
MLRKRLMGLALALLLLVVQLAGAGTALAAERDVAGLTAAERDRLDTFFSNFSEAGLPEFTNGNLALDAILNFGVDHVRLNTPGREMISLDARHWGVPADQVRAAVHKYFGYTLADSDLRATTRYSLSNSGYYILPKADGEGATFSQVVTFNATGEGQYEATVNVYKASPTFTGDVHAAPAEWLKGDRQELPHLVAVYHAEVSVADLAGPTYYLVAYQKQQ